MFRWSGVERMDAWMEEKGKTIKDELYFDENVLFPKHEDVPK